MARDLVNSPGYAMTPARMGEEALALGERLGLKVTVLDKAQLTEQGFGGILAVGQGSANDPRFIVMEHGCLLYTSQARTCAGGPRLSRLARRQH